ncbi:MAG: pantoate--beta-alanine ligase [Rikenellaceae bacterium]|nr:pantoate--beta-alanine ligase [Rikenellaceae bacterium]
MKIVTSVQDLRSELSQVDAAQVGFVPTMGALHSGHISLVERARRECGVVVVSVFVNPTQFNDPNDLKNYPRTPEADAEMLRAAGVDVVFMPSVEEMYPTPDTRVFDFGNIDKVMEGATRPGHFNGVAQVVSRLFDMVRPAKAYFGEKDFQQIAVIRAMVAQLALTVEIIPCPIVRDVDGLALSSRNTLLTPEYRAAAPDICAALRKGAAAVGEKSPAEVEALIAETIECGGMLKVIYVQVVDGTSLERVDSWSVAEGGCIQCCVAVQAGEVRLIDNMRMV